MNHIMDGGELLVTVAAPASPDEVYRDWILIVFRVRVRL
jgi:hypothetical protein